MVNEVENRVIVEVIVVVDNGDMDIDSNPVSPLQRSVVHVQANVISSMLIGSHEGEGRMGASVLPRRREFGLKHSLTVE